MSPRISALPRFGTGELTTDENVTDCLKMAFIEGVQLVFGQCFALGFRRRVEAELGPDGGPVDGLLYLLEHFSTTPDYVV